MTDLPPPVVLAVTSWDTPCGIANHTDQMLRSLVGVRYRYPSAESLDPNWVLGELDQFTVCWINHHDALHSRWRVEHLHALRAAGKRIVVTWHDTQAAGNSDKAKAFCEAADVFVVHEPVTDLPGSIWLRQGVHRGVEPWAYDFPPHVPILGTVGFSQGWRAFDQLAAVTADCGWGLVILSCNATAAEENRWRETNPTLRCTRRWLDTSEVVARLTGCDATVFVHQCANTGTSGTIRLGIAARKPVIAMESKQYRDLKESEYAGCIEWCEDFEELGWLLGQIRIQRTDPLTVRLATADSWERQGRRYAELLRGDTL